MYSYDILFDFTQQVFLKMGLSANDARQATDIIMRAELRNISTHGLMRLPEYVHLWKTKRITVNPNYRIVHETLSTALVDGGKGFGLVTAPKAMRLAIEKAKNVGTGWVAVRNSYHFGIAGYYAMMALKEDMIGIATTNANPLVAPTFGKEGRLGTNPIAVAIPAGEEPPFVADFATSPVSRGKLDVLNSEGKIVVNGIVQDKNGNATNDAAILQKGGALRTLGGDVESGGHKGFCITSLVDIFSAVLSGANFGPTVVPTLNYVKTSPKVKDKGIGHFFGAMRIDAFQSAENFKNDMDSWIRTMKKTPVINGKDHVIIPGEPERLSESVKMKKGITLNKVCLKGLEEVAVEFGLEGWKVGG